MIENEYSFNEKIEHIKKAILKYAPAKYIYLFGSHAYGEPSEISDIDIYAVLPDDFEIDFFLKANIRRELANNNIYEIDLLINNESNFNYRKTRSLFENIIIERGSLIHEYS